MTDTPINYSGWLGIETHERARPHNPATTRAFNNAVHAKEQAAERAAREAQKRKQAHNEPSA